MNDAYDAASGATQAANAEVDATSGATQSWHEPACEDDVDAVSAATNLAEKAAQLEASKGVSASFPPPPAPAPAGMSAPVDNMPDMDNVFEGQNVDCDAATGATPGVAAACQELGMSSLSDVVSELGIKPPGIR